MYQHFFKSLATLVFCLLSILVKESIQNLSSGFPTCKVKDPNFPACLDKAIETGVRFLRKGVPEYNLPPLEPFTLPSLEIGAGQGTVHLVQNYKNVEVVGLTDVAVNNSHVDLEKKTTTFSTFHPLITLKANYDINGKILVLPVYGKGPCVLTFENVFSNHIVHFKESKKDGKTYFTPKDYSFKMHLGRVSHSFDNLFNGNKLLGDNINDLINKEWMAVFDDVGQGYELAFAQIFLNYAKKIFAKAPVNEIFV